MTIPKPIPLFIETDLSPGLVAEAARLFMAYPVSQQDACLYLQLGSVHQAEQACQLRRAGGSRSEVEKWMRQPRLLSKPKRVERPQGVVA